MKEKVKQLIDLVKDNYLEIDDVNIVYTTATFESYIVFFNKNYSSNITLYLRYGEEALIIATEILNDIEISFERVITLIEGLN